MTGQAFEEDTSFGQARKDVMGIVSATDPLAASLEYIADTDDPSLLKVAEYALLVPSIKQGVSNYLTSPADVGAQFQKPSELVEQIGTEVGNSTAQAFEETAFKDIIEMLAKRRADMVTYGGMIYPVERNLRAAAMFSAGSTFAAVISNALVIDKVMPHIERPRRQFISAVKASHQPVISRAVMNIVWNSNLTEEFAMHAEGLLTDQTGRNHDGIEYDPNTDKAKLVKPLNKWILTKGIHLYIPADNSVHELEDSGRTIGDIETDDVRVGCPFSFEPELLKRYYEYVVDSLESTNCWPDALRNRSGPSDIKRLGVSTLQSLLGFQN